VAKENVEYQKHLAQWRQNVCKLVGQVMDISSRIFPIAMK
jgi:hypothetical protein